MDNFRTVETRDRAAVGTHFFSPRVLLHINRQDLSLERERLAFLYLITRRRSMEVQNPVRWEIFAAAWTVITYWGLIW